MNRRLPIALFDSGVGGLTVFRAIKKLLPEEDMVYLGDTARVPYGTRSQETIIRYTCNAAEKLLGHGAKMLVIACNTATAAALPVLREKCAPVPVIGVVEPGAKAAVEASNNLRIGVIGTEATIRGEAYQKAIKKLSPGAKITARPCTLFVALAEEGWALGPIAEAVARKYLEEMFPPTAKPGSWPDTLLLGCTHFPLFAPVIKKIVGDAVKIVDSAESTAQAVKKHLKDNDMQGDGRGVSRFLITDNRDRFMRSGALFLGESMDKTSVELVDL